MKIYSVNDKEFREYGRVIQDDFSDILEGVKETSCPENATMYNPGDARLEAMPSFKTLSKDYYGNMPVQIGYCNGHNHKLNCLEYHKDSEINMANEEFILLLGRLADVENGHYDTSKVKAFLVPAKTAVEVYATSLHYAPVSVNGNGFRVIVVLPKGTNVSSERSSKEPLLWATNKWLIAHPESSEAAAGAFAGLDGENITLE